MLIFLVILGIEMSTRIKTMCEKHKATRIVAELDNFS